MDKYKLMLGDEQIAILEPFESTSCGGGNYKYVSRIDNTHTFKDATSTIIFTTEQLELNELDSLTIGDEVYIKYTL